MYFNTAIFYDIENLLKGYSFSQQMADNLSLRDILADIRDTSRLGHIALQRAYANWSDHRLKLLRGQINELGIEPVQVLGFSQDPKKNAADIQLAIDAIDIAHIRPALSVYVIISGDGGFASLAKKLHEYGKTVIGCAYRNATNRVFQAVCDDFVWITDPDEADRPERTLPGDLTSPRPQVNDPRNVRLTKVVKRLSSQETEAVLAKTHEVLQWYAAEHHHDLSRQGIVLSVVQEALNFLIPEFQPARYGFPKFIEYLQYACTGTPLCVVRPASGQVHLSLRNGGRGGAEVLPDLQARDLHSPEGYRAVLAAGTGPLRLPPGPELSIILRWLVEHPRSGVDVGTIYEEAEAQLGSLLPPDSVKAALMSLIWAEAFERTPEGAPLSDQQLTLRPELNSVAALTHHLRSAARRKLTRSLAVVREAVLEEVIPLVE